MGGYVLINEYVNTLSITKVSFVTLTLINEYMNTSSITKVSFITLVSDDRV